MRLKDSKSIFGIDTGLIKVARKKYNRWVICAIVLDLFLLGGGILLLGQTAPLTVYLLLCILVAVITNLLITLVTKSDYRQVFSFYNRYKSKCCMEKNYNVTNENLFSILFCAGYTRVKPDQSRDTYLECMRSACCLNNKYSRRIAKYLLNYEVADGGTLKCVIITEGKAKFVDIMGE